MSTDYRCNQKTAFANSWTFDLGANEFADDFYGPVAKVEGSHIEFPYPTHGAGNCVSCHDAGTNDVPDRAKSLPGLLSGSGPLKGKERTIGVLPSSVTGPASSNRGMRRGHRPTAMPQVVLSYSPNMVYFFRC